jgi:hypothetical protein
MAGAYYSTVFDQPVERVWAAIRDFGAYTDRVDGVDESGIEDGKAGDTVGAVRSIRMGERHIRQRLLAHSDLARCYTYEFCTPPPAPLANYRATIRASPISDGNRAFVEWQATFDCAPADIDHWAGFYATSFGTWLASLRAHLG